MDKMQLRYKSSKIKGEIGLSGSKSISNRLLVMAQLANATASFNNLSDSDDTLRIQKCLQEIEVCSSSRIPLIVDAGNAGTVYRFLAAFLSLQSGKWLLTGNQRMKQRPVDGLVDALQHIGAKIRFTGESNFPPLQINGADLKGGSVDVDASKSSQFVTALMLMAPYLENGLNIRLVKRPVSFAYIQMTASLMKQCGILVKIKDEQIIIEPGGYVFKDMDIEPDWSSASYWYEVAALSENAEIFLTGFTKKSIQGDSICVELFQKLGVNTAFEKTGIRLTSYRVTDELFEFDFTDYPDLVPSVMATCAAKQIKAVFYGTEHLRFKESDRIKSLSAELQKIGTKFRVSKDKITLSPSKSVKNIKPLIFNTYDDHRLAMCLAPLVLIFNEVIIKDPEVVSKSYPGFWKDIKRLGIGDVLEL